MHRIAELLGGRSIRIVRAEVGVVGFVAVGAPVPLVLAGLGVEHDHAMVAVAVGDVHFIGLFVDKRLGRQPEVLDVVAAFALVGLADLHQEFSVLREFQDHVVVVATSLAAAADSSGAPPAAGLARAAGPGHCRQSRRCPCSRR